MICTVLLNSSLHYTILTELPFQVLERGSHQELVELGGKYAEMWRIQNREGEEKKEDVEKDKGGGEDVIVRRV